MITKFKAHDFTAFSDLQLQFSPGINILIGENGTGKTDKNSDLPVQVA